jgi:DNA repair exonuclease SbcCD ATPase subunit
MSNMNIRSSLDKANFDYQRSLKAVEEEQTRIQQFQQSLADCQTAVSIVQTVAQSIEQAVHNKIAVVVSNCLEAIFDDPYTFKITFERKRNRTEAQLLFTRNGMDVDPMTAAGGGAVDVAAFALRVACLTIQKHLQQVLILDEPFRFVSREFRPRIRALIESLSRDLGIQFLIVTHMDVLRTGTVVTIGT